MALEKYYKALLNNDRHKKSTKAEKSKVKAEKWKSKKEEA
jgi:hypothetical protein